MIFLALLIIYYNHTNKSFIIDKHRAWPQNIAPLKAYLGYEPKIICTNRRISEIVVSYITLVEKTGHINNFIDNKLRKDGKEINNFNRAEEIFNGGLMGDKASPYKSIERGLKISRNH